MSLNFTNFAPLTDFSLIEIAVQKYFVAADGSNFVTPPDDSDATREQWVAPTGSIAFYTAFQALTFQKCRPRVFIGLHSINPVSGAYALDVNGNLREKAWAAQMMFGVITDQNYTKHTQLRAQVLALIQEIIGQIAADNSLFATTGVNPFLAYHQVGQFYATNTSTDIGTEDGAYQSTIPVALNFSVKPTAWPAGMQTV